MHPHMVLSLREYEELSSLPEKNSMIIATGQAPINYLLWSTFSLILRNNGAFLDHLLFAINGPCKKTGDPALQDKKQRFLEILRDEYDVPITVNRVWSRIGHAQAMESIIPWVHTEYYSIMHDDVIVLRNDWGDISLNSFKQNSNLALQTPPPIMRDSQGVTKHQGKPKIGLPHIHSAFIVCRKSAIMETGARWWGHHVEKDFEFDDKSVTDFNEYNQNKLKILPQEGQKFNFANTDIGSWVVYKLENAGYTIECLPEDSILHFGAASWSSGLRYKNVKYLPFLEKLEEEINSSKFADLYENYKENWHG